jgi:hypothetical protein
VASRVPVSSVLYSMKWPLFYELVEAIERICWSKRIAVAASRFPCLSEQSQCADVIYIYTNIFSIYIIL